MQHQTQKGMTLIETVVAIALFSFVTVTLGLLIQLGTKLVRDDQARLDAVAIAQSRMETIKHIPYEEIGTINGVPEGLFEQEETIIRNAILFTVITDIRYIDDPFDGSAPLDTVNTDYKKIRVSVSWQGHLLDEPVTLITSVAPNGVETNQGGGTLWIEVYNANVEPVINATVTMSNDAVNPAISLTSVTDGQGRYILPGAAAAVESYHVLISKNGYSSAQTYSVDLENNPNPDPADLSVVESQVTTKTFTIDTVGSLPIHVQDVQTGTAISSLPLQIVGAKRIGTDLEGSDIPKYTQTITTNSSGDVSLTNMEYDTYRIDIDDDLTGVDFAGSSPHLPFVLPPGGSQAITIHTAPNASETLLVTVGDGNENPVEGATVHIFNVSGTIELTQTTNASGQTFLTPLQNDTCTLEVSAAGFDTYSSAVQIDGDTQFIVPLTPSL